MVITFNFRNIDNPPNEALLVLFKAKVYLNKVLIDTCLCYMRKF